MRLLLALLALTLTAAVADAGHIRARIADRRACHGGRPAAVAFRPAAAVAAVATSAVRSAVPCLSGTCPTGR